MVNDIRFGRDDLPYVDYSDLLEKILQVLRNAPANLFKLSEDGNRLIVDFDEVAAQVAMLKPANPLGASANSVKAATVNFSPGFEESFPKKIGLIKRRLQELLQGFLNSGGTEITIENFVGSLLTDLQQFKSNNANLDLSYSFGNYPGLQKRRLTLEKEAANQQLLKFHKLTVTVRNSQEFNGQLREGIQRYIQAKFAGEDEGDLEELEDILADLESHSDFKKLKGIVDRDTLGKLKRQGMIFYLKFLRNNAYIGGSNPNPQGILWLDVLISRLQRIESYINDVNRGDGHYLVNYAGVQLNYRDFFARAEAFDMLPVIPKIDGYLGETKNESNGELNFILGLKLKFDGEVQAHGNDKGKKVFDYYTTLLDPNSKEHQREISDPQRREIFARKVLRIVFLYYFVFAGNKPATEGYPESDLNYDPVVRFETAVLPVLQGGDDEAKRTLFGNILRGFEQYKITERIKEVKTLLKKVIERKTTFAAQEEAVHIDVSRSILEDNIERIINRSTFFKDEEFSQASPKQVLKYLTVGDANLAANSLLSLRGSLRIDEVNYYGTDDQQSFTMQYDEIDKIKALPVVFLSRDELARQVYNEQLNNRKLVAFPYKLERDNLEPPDFFAYKFIFSLLVYIFLKLLLGKNRLFVPLLRLQVSNKDDSLPIEKFILDFSIVLAHLLNQEYRANAQGIDIRTYGTNTFSFKLKNAMSSLYSVLPKKFILPPKLLPQLDKLGIVIVSSRECDKSWRSNQKISNLMGEILVGVKQEEGIQIRQIRTFSGNYEHQEMFQRPQAIIDQIHDLYKRGVRHFLYIAKAPYSSTLHLTREEDDDGLFFMSKEVIKNLKGSYEDIKIYPMFFDKYYAVNLQNLKAQSLYIQDTSELTALLDDRNQQCVVFFNLFNGISVGNDRNYNGVISYATLLNFYGEIMPTANIYEGLISDTPLKEDILQYLSLFHFSRYEATARRDQPINFKLDPYQNLIGDFSVGAFSSYEHMTGKGTFNSLAFLTRVKSCLDIQ
ncbi:hypothetical protein NG798_02980 [Ancylothrix sp. C2]|uniref:hypothetical protein n=1 Tax=Ancylothrix sp. D3o TaxID=2953691 RepID=UPI0021BB5658|nr:hypothetical protein [Ancylothrix sp. D3o]MCT7948744.1 hypothetical protein [Ancylothrix sp. D3o]